VAAWDLSCPDWEERFWRGRSLVPELPLDQAEAARAVAIFNKLRLPDVPGTPLLEDAAGDWFREIVRALLGSLDPVTRQRMVRELFLLVPKKNSKALALDTPIATPHGFIPMGGVEIGDEVLDSDGLPTVVTAKSEVFVNHECYEIEFSTGERVVCDAEHLWVTDAHADRQRAKTRSADERKIPRPSVKSTREIAETLHVRSGSTQVANHRTALCGALVLPRAVLPIDPYVLGAWLGDGHSSGAAITSGREDADHMVAEIRSRGHSARILGLDPRSNAVRISIAEEGPRAARLKYRFRSEAGKLGLIGNKHIPQQYLRAAREQRLELLRGLMDTDGSISIRGQASFTTMSPVLRDGVVELVASLGWKPSVSEHRAKIGARDCGPAWRVQFWPFDSAEVFTIQRKLERQRPNGASGARRSTARQIVSAHRVPSVPTQCISVESKTKQYLVTRSLIPTHNTTNGALMMLTALLMNQRPKATFLLTAPVQDVSELAFEAIKGAIDLDEVLSRTLHVRDHLKTVVHRVTKAELQVMTFDPAVLTGQKPVGVLIDEVHVIAKMSKAASAIRQLRGGMLPFPEAFLAMITTQSEDEPQGVFKAELLKAREIRDGKRTGSMLPVLYEFPVKAQLDEKVWANPRYWHLVTPNLDRSIRLDRLQEDFQTAKDTSEAEFRAWASQHLNVEIGIALAEGAWAGARFWAQCARPEITLEYILAESDVMTVGIDGGGLDDLLGLVVLGRHRETAKWMAWAHAWAHPSVLETRKEIAPKLNDLKDAGDLTFVERVGADVEEVVQIVLRVKDTGKLDKAGVDRYGIGSILEGLEDIGLSADDVVGIPQGWQLVGAIKTAERELAGGNLLHGGQALMTWCVGNARTEKHGNALSITKQVSGTAKIDPLMALFDAVTLMALNPKPKGSVYDDIARERKLEAERAAALAAARAAEREPA